MPMMLIKFCNVMSIIFHILCKVIIVLPGLQLEFIKYWIKMKGNHWVFNLSWWC